MLFDILDNCSIAHGSCDINKLFEIYSRILKHHKVILVTTFLDHELVRKANMIPASDVNEALEMALEMMGKNAQVVVIPDGVAVLAVKG